jgi:hypothetical protein
MKKYFSLLISIQFCINSFSQNAQPLISAEKAFEKSCLEKGIRNGFLSQVDSNGIEFTDKGPVDAKEFWRSLPVFDGIFSWAPTYSEMSISGDWGYTTGNYEHRPKTLKDEIDESGQYTTLWGKNDKGEWKYLLDIGTAHAFVPLDKSSKTIVSKKYGAGKLTGKNILSGIEKEFINSFDKSVANAYAEYGSREYILNIPQHWPVTTTDSSIMLIGKMGDGLKYQPSAAKVSPGNDMAAVYGTTSLGNKSGSYLRIWRHEKDGWKIALEVIRI